MQKRSVIMKKCCLFLGILLLSCFLVPNVIGETSVMTDGVSFLCGEEIQFNISSEHTLFQFSMFLDGSLLFQSDETTAKKTAFLPRSPGEYLLSVRAFDPGNGVEETAEFGFSVTQVPECSIHADKSELKLGDAVVLSGSVPRKTDMLQWSFSVYKMNERIWSWEGNQSECLYIPPETGTYDAVLTVTDRKGNHADSRISFTVIPGDGLFADEGSGLFYLYGGIHSWRITGGIWEATCNDDHFQLLSSAGSDGDYLTVLAPPDVSMAHDAECTVHSSAGAILIHLKQVPDDSIEEELLLYSPQEKEPGQQLLFLKGHETVREVTVVPDGPWHAFPDQPEVGIQKIGNRLILTVPENDSAQPCYYHIRVQDDGKDAHVVILQEPGNTSPAILKIERMNGEAPVMAYADKLRFLVTCSENTDELLVEYEHGETWHFPVSAGLDETNEICVPALGSGEQVLLFTPCCNGQKGIPTIKKVSVIPEKPAVTDASASITAEETLLKIITTRETYEIILEDDTGHRTVIARSQASVDQYINSDNLGRYALWSVSLTGGSFPVSCIADGSKIRISYQPADSTEEKVIRPYDQLNGIWKDVPYSKSDLQTSGCAIFTLSTALKLLGYEGNETEPGILAENYRKCLVEGGTLNSTLIGNAGKDFHFRTNYELYKSKQEVMRFFERGAVFSFSPVNGHIALADRISPDGKYIHIMDSALSATFSRLPDGRKMYLLSEQGEYIAVEDPAQIEGARYYMETNAYSGGEYWLETSYVLWRGVRLILPE